MGVLSDNFESAVAALDAYLASIDAEVDTLLSVSRDTGGDTNNVKAATVVTARTEAAQARASLLSTNIRDRLTRQGL